MVTISFFFTGRAPKGPLRAAGAWAGQQAGSAFVSFFVGTQPRDQSMLDGPGDKDEEGKEEGKEGRGEGRDVRIVLFTPSLR